MYYTLKSLIEDQTKQAGLEKMPLLDYLVNQQGGIFHLLHEKFK